MTNGQKGTRTSRKARPIPLHKLVCVRNVHLKRPAPTLSQFPPTALGACGEPSPCRRAPQLPRRHAGQVTHPPPQCLRRCAEKGTIALLCHWKNTEWGSLNYQDIPPHMAIVHITTGKKERKMSMRTTHG